MRALVVAGLVAAALACVGQAASARPWNGRYKVRPGDSLTLIARRYRVPFPALARANYLDWRRPLPIGVVLRVPSRGHANTSASVSYVVRAGDTLSGIADRYHLPLAQLAAANRLNPAGLLFAGAHLVIPTRAASAFTLAHVVESDPYRRGVVGHDLSYPNCAAHVPTAGFAIIGLNGGRPFTTNWCLTHEWQTAAPPRSVYINTAYSRSLLSSTTAGCAASAARQRLRAAARRAYALGCSEAEYDLAQIRATPPVVIWLDVEPDNAWSTRRTLNAATIRGILDRLFNQPRHPAIGIYSNPSFWQTIAGHWTSLSVPEWIAPSNPDPPGCPNGFAAGPVWLSQTTDGHLDHDTAC